MLILIAIAILAVIIGLVGIYAMRTGKKPLEPMSAGMMAGGIAGVVIGILLVEFAGFEYPFPVVLWFLGMAAGQITGLIYKKTKE
jgi:F0F1-type ATP synthase assembly protein I